MKELVCKMCGNDEFIWGDSEKVVCKCGLVLKIPCENAAQEKLMKASQKLKTEIIVKVSLLTKEIDKCLDDRNKRRFHKLSAELKQYNEILNTEFLLMEKYTKLRKKFDSIVYDRTV
ncbi:IDEAL domain-containing protein [Neobacillus sp. NRS-1170]|uniref:IDEAL domain-containing protein n=1 Tax=Neobacillus sp. NRS-1170 TaxID=3233898 RepID=UPI003D26E6EB